MNEVRSPKKPLIFYYIVAMLLVMLFNFIAMPWLSQYQIKEVDYNTFVSMTEQGQVGQVEIQQQNNRLLFTSTDGKTIYKTAMVPDDGLVQRLLDAGVSTTGEEIEQTSLLVSILGWVVPLVIFIGLGQLMYRSLMKKLGGGSNSMGMFTAFLGDPLDIYGVEPLGKGPRLGDHSASITYGRKGVLHGFESIMLQDEDGNPGPVHSVASGLDYPSVGPEHAYLHDIGRVNYVTATDEEAVDAFFKLSRYEGIIPALESSHAIAYAMKWARENRGGAILVNCSGRGDKDVDYVVEHYGYGEDHQFPA